MGTTYKIKQGDNLSSIAKRYGTTVSDLQKANDIKNPNLIIAGKTLNIPSSNLTQQGGLEGGNSSPLPPESSAPSYTRGTFTESDETKNAYNSLTGATDALTNLGDFNWINQGKLDEYANKYENRGDFSYDFNADALYQQYKDKYIKQAKMASADVMGQAAAMNGGYGSSYAQTLGNQAYQASLEQLNDVIPELYQMAYDRYNQEGQDMLNMISLLRGERDFAYGQYNDEYSKLASDRAYWSDMHNNLYNRDYTEYSDKEAYKYGAYRDSVADKQWQDTFDEGKRQYNEEMAFQKQQYEDSQSLFTGGTSGGSEGSSSNSKSTSAKTSKAITALVTPHKGIEASKFIKNQKSLSEWVRSGGSTSSYMYYIDKAIRENEDNFSDEELAYLKKHYGF